MEERLILVANSRAVEVRPFCRLTYRASSLGPSLPNESAYVIADSCDMHCPAAHALPPQRPTRLDSAIWQVAAGGRLAGGHEPLRRPFGDRLQRAHGCVDVVGIKLA